VLVAIKTVCEPDWDDGREQQDEAKKVDVEEPLEALREASSKHAIQFRWLLSALSLGKPSAQ
jgi:hypothetical protein